MKLPDSNSNSTSSSPAQDSADCSDWDPQLQRLLQLKRFETPPPGYFEDFLGEFQRRQRLEAMRPKLWEQWREQLGDFLDHFRVPTTAYAAVGVLAVAATAWIFTSEEMAVRSSAQAQMAEAALPQAALRMELSSPPPTALPNPVTIPSQRFVGTLPPQYLLHSRPAAEDDPFSF